MSGEREWLRRVFGVLVEADLNWLIAEIVVDWEAGGLPSGLGDDETVVAARQVFSAIDTIQTTLVTQLEALNYVRVSAPGAVWQDATFLDGAVLSVDDQRGAGYARDADAIGALLTFVDQSREQLQGDWPDFAFGVDLV